MTLAQYCSQFQKIRRANGIAFSDLTLKKAPHKPLLLLAVLDMVGRKQITSPFISIADEMTELNALFGSFWHKLMPVTHTSSIGFPFSKMGNEPFWHLVPLPDKTVTKELIEKMSTVSQLRQHVMGAQLDEALFALMQDAQSRQTLIDTLIGTHFSPEAQALLRAEMGEQDTIFQYSLELEQQAQHKVRDSSSVAKYTVQVRDQGFRKAVVRCYDHRCAMCGTRIVTPEGYTAVDAAHIEPWSVSQNDQITNGMALCKLCHWAFDTGVIGVRADFSIAVARQIGQMPNAPGFIPTLAGRTLILPKEVHLRPKPENFEWHRKTFSVA
ncbi:HNH endonuclease [Chitinibacter sp. GC72]|uniref:HNH endonuclease n=1 Tax=Chitinibacter sp. GC72 TaxID=1526917 RepID=UPI0012F8C9C2|nr:HNH endonuclease [Chitinibacter sp. GC72]